ncbi:hypothetical protein MNBD_GAMMA22-1407 [hydrothermal vent metagenome]|uniref:Preprotein translocase subunit YajC n=1 Tax=hydrothermal vent metagenome TaxID=652676 RepID=A0A3B1AHU3_9ZZZZ
MTIIRVLVIFLVFWLIFRLIRIKMDKRRVPGKKPPKIVDIKKCNFCGVHIPIKDSIKSGNNYYCSTEHMNLDNQNN